MDKIKKKLFGSPDQANMTIMVIMFVGIFAALSLALGKTFLSANNFVSMASQIPEFGFLAFGIAVCMIGGGTDMSIVANANLATIVCANVMKKMAETGNVTTAIVVGMALGLLVSILCGALNGFLISCCKINALMATMGTMLFYSGIGMVITKGKTVSGLPYEFMDISLIKFLGIPLFFWILLVGAAILIFVLSYTTYGKRLYLYGTNRTVYLFSGAKVGSLMMVTFTLGGFLSGIGGLLMLCRVCSASPSFGETYLLQAILVCALGGISALGGRGKIAGVLLGLGVLQMLQSGFTLLGFEQYYKNFIWGIVLIIVLIANYYIEAMTKKAPKVKAGK